MDGNIGGNNCGGKNISEECYPYLMFGIAWAFLDPDMQDGVFWSFHACIHQNMTRHFKLGKLRAPPSCMQFLQKSPRDFRNYENFLLWSFFKKYDHT